MHYTNLAFLSSAPVAYMVYDTFAVAKRLHVPTKPLHQGITDKCLTHSTHPSLPDEYHEAVPALWHL